MAAALKSGDKAPDFTLPVTADQKVALADFRGTPLVMVFYPADWSPVCSDELAIFNELLPEFKRRHTQVVGVSVDGAWCHSAFSKHRKLHFPLLADFEPKGNVARAFGVYRQGEGITERALFVLDEEGVIRWSHVSPVGVNPGAAGVLDALDSMQTAKGGSL